MTLRAFAFFRARFELAFVGIRFVTVVAVLEQQEPLEVTIQMTLRTSDLGMFSEERVLRL